ncbi:hypothetical protein [Niabella aurantiaca]|uniref:hypothetical protein n=1 Tax=Niabella aurantiaca TaxID=379900 RepID=UPI0003714885|nr:hypothetical protein [Niabella aurantiaca]
MRTKVTFFAIIAVVLQLAACSKDRNGHKEGYYFDAKVDGTTKSYLYGADILPYFQGIRNAAGTKWENVLLTAGSAMVNDNSSSVFLLQLYNDGGNIGKGTYTLGKYKN